MTEETSGKREADERRDLKLCRVERSAEKQIGNAGMDVEMSACCLPVNKVLRAGCEPLTDRVALCSLVNTDAAFICNKRQQLRSQKLYDDAHRTEE